MLDRFETPLHYLRLFVAGIVVIAGLLLLVYMFADARAYGFVGARQENTIATDDVTTDEWYDQTNVITRSTERMTKDFGQATENIGRETSHLVRTIGSATVKSASYIINSYFTGLRFAATTMLDIVVFAGRSAGYAVSHVSKSRLVSAVIKPDTNSQIPEINPEEALTFTRHEHETKIPSPEQIAVQAPETAAWPIHGRITTLFGVPHWPYQPTHTGLDISSGKSSGKTAVHPFKPGKVLDTITSKSGLGNHVVIDHGNGITSVYAHLASIAVSIGQDVNNDTTIGYEGTTGVSTGTHLHFEIRVNGQPVNPYDYVNGQP